MLDLFRVRGGFVEEKILSESEETCDCGVRLCIDWDSLKNELCCGKKIILSLETDVLGLPRAD
jgi:hypothetical protein